ncbi:MarR family transcriptional regulator [Streptomyces sp. NBC_01298]|uniref:MarR family winged helix-turn-helix transcriptional regulator n=1 Tax=Streptomyces sp. NBC_01298 TaxID=2903817 RepID=UPI002E133E89|nr:MarR family transcriptional regulator [Streptomyces sp. NBC_01298]
MDETGKGSTADAMDDLFGDPRWETYGMLREAYLAVTGRIDAEVSPGGDVEASISDLLFRLARTPGHALRTVDITRALATSTTRTTRLLDAAEKRGLVTRGAHPTDRRVTLVAPTEEGLKEARERGRLGLASTQRHLHDVLTAEEISAMIPILRKIRDANQ